MADQSPKLALVTPDFCPPKPVEEEPAFPVVTISLVNELGMIKPLDDIIQEAVRNALDVCGGSMSRVARELGIGRSTLYRYLKAMPADPN